jgi:hypothetical protein
MLESKSIWACQLSVQDRKLGYLRPTFRHRRAAALKVADPLMLRAIAAAKKKNDRVDAQKICDCLRCDFLPECSMATTAIRERRRTLRYRNLLVRQERIDSSSLHRQKISPN